ncbi:hypothetical protein [Thermococcus sp.]
MRLGIPQLDKFLGDIQPGSTVLVSTIGELGIEIVITAIKENREKSVVFVTPRIRKQLEQIPKLRDISYFTLGEDFAPQELFEITRIGREILKNYMVGVLFLQPLLIFHSPDMVYRVFSELSDIALRHDLILISIIDKRLVDERTLASFEESATHVIDIVEVVEGFRVIRGLRIKKSPRGSTDFYRLEIVNGKIIIGEAIE